MEPIQLFSIAILIISIIAHEIAHGYVAYFFGDPTAKIAGRLTANPVKHFDPIGSFVVPVFFYLLSGGVAGWAKPVPYNPYMLRGRFAEVAVASAGVATNMAIACISSLILYILNQNSAVNYAHESILIQIVFINVGLAIFNLLPFPPFDGLRIITSVAQGFGVPRRTFAFAEHPMWIIVSLIIAFNIWPIIYPVVRFTVDLLVR